MIPAHLSDTMDDGAWVSGQTPSTRMQIVHGCNIRIWVRLGHWDQPSTGLSGVGGGGGGEDT